jgi:hypothetical protein
MNNLLSMESCWLTNSSTTRISKIWRIDDFQLHSQYKTKKVNTWITLKKKCTMFVNQVNRKDDNGQARYTEHGVPRATHTQFPVSNQIAKFLSFKSNVDMIAYNQLKIVDLMTYLMLRSLMKEIQHTFSNFSRWLSSWTNTYYRDRYHFGFGHKISEYLRSHYSRRPSILLYSRSSTNDNVILKSLVSVLTSQPAH